MMGMGIVPLFNFPPSPPPQNHLNHKNHSLDDGYGNCVTFFTPPPQNQNNHKNHSQDGWVWILRPLLICFSRHILKII